MSRSRIPGKRHSRPDGGALRPQSVRVRAFLSGLEAKLLPLQRAANLAKWDQFVGAPGSDPNLSASLALEQQRLYQDPEGYRLLETCVGRGRRSLSALQARQAKVLWRAFQRSQFAGDRLPDLLSREAQARSRLSSFRPTMDGTRTTEHALRETLRLETDSERCRTAWEASKEVGREMAPLILDLVRLRNDIARSHGFHDYCELDQSFDDFDGRFYTRLFQRMTSVTEEPYRAVKARMDRELAGRFSCSPSDLRPWHYGDVRLADVPGALKSNLDEHFAKHDPLQLLRSTYEAMGFSIEPVLRRSDLEPRPGKVQSPLTMIVDRAFPPDVRVLHHLTPSEWGLYAAFHEFGHGLYATEIPGDLPFFLRMPVGTVVNEGVAIFFDRITRRADWFEEFLGIPTTDARKYAAERSQKGPIFARWALTVCHFERELYRNPEQDLNGLWWELTKRYQGIEVDPERRHFPDWAAVPHFTIVPLYYPSYLAAEAVASQLEAAIPLPASASSYFRPHIAEFFREHVFRHGARYTEPTLLQKATGRRFSTAAYAEDLEPRFQGP